MFKNKQHSSIVLLLTILFSSSSLAAPSEKALDQTVDIPTLADAQVFAEYTDKLPAVVNYFSSASEKDIIAFYSNAYGEIKSQETKRKRLTLTFHQDNAEIRVVISNQNKKRQVDVLIVAL